MFRSYKNKLRRSLKVPFSKPDVHVDSSWNFTPLAMNPDEGKKESCAH